MPARERFENAMGECLKKFPGARMVPGVMEKITLGDSLLKSNGTVALCEVDDEKEVGS